MSEIEFASVAKPEDRILLGWRSLAQHTGLPIERIAELAARNELRSLFGASGSLRPTEELRSLAADGKPPPRAELRSVSMPADGGLRRKRLTGREAQREVFRKYRLSGREAKRELYERYRSPRRGDSV
jgi:hypothetical protein